MDLNLWLKEKKSRLNNIFEKKNIEKFKTYFTNSDIKNWDQTFDK